jgi:cytochrome P450
MDYPGQDMLVLDNDLASSDEFVSPPRQPKWTDTLAYIADPDQFCRVNLARYGPIFKTGVFGGTTVFVGSVRANQMAFNGDGSYTEIGLPPTTMAMFGEYSLFQRPDLHRRRKRALKPAFTGQMLAGYVPRMHRVIEQHLQTWGTTHPIKLVPAVEALSFDVLAPLLLGIDLSQGDEAFQGLPITSKSALKQQYKTFFDGFYGLLKWRSPLTAFGRGWQARSRLLEFMRAIIQQRRGRDIDSTQDFLAMMLTSQQETPESIFSDALIENQALLQLWASHYEVTGLLSSWMYQLGRHTEALARVRAEQTAVGINRADLVQVGIEQLKAMPYLDATIRETLRTLPPTSTANRRLTQSVVLDGMLYEKGWTVIAEPRIAHAMEEHFTNPDQFVPERFLPDQNEGKQYEFIPFGGGVHVCLGAQLALVMAKLFAIHLLQEFDWQLGGTAPFVQFPLKQIKNRYQVRLMRRSREAK